MAGTLIPATTEEVSREIRDGKVAENPQLILLDLCAGLDGLDDALENLGNVEVLTTVDSSYYGKANLKDEDGKFEGVESYEMTPTLLSTWTSIIKGRGLHQDATTYRIWSWVMTTSITPIT